MALACEAKANLHPLPFYTINVTSPSEVDNRAIVCTIDAQISFSAQLVKVIPCVHLGGRPSQCFPFYAYAEDGTHRRELPRIPFVGAKETAGMPAIFVAPTSSPAGAREYSPGRQPWVDNKKENNSALPKAVAEGRSPEATSDPDDHPYPKLSEQQKHAVLSGIKNIQDAGELIPTRLRYFRAFVSAGKRLAEIHVHYEQQPEYPLKKIEKTGEKLDYRVEKMKLSKDKTQLIYNKFLTLADIPPETYEYRLGNRSALEWIIDQYQVSTDKRSGITNDPNRGDDPTCILRLIGQVITVSIETVGIVKALPALEITR